MQLTFEVSTDQPFLMPVPPITRHQGPATISLQGGRIIERSTAVNTGQEAILIGADGYGPVRVAYDFPPADGAREAARIFQPINTSWLRPSPALADLAKSLTADLSTPRAKLERIVAHVADVFTYDHPDTYLGAGLDALPALDVCDAQTGSCVDIHSYAVAALCVVGIGASYVAGAWVSAKQIADAAPGPVRYLPGHCWMVVSIDGDIEDWDISHFLKFGVPLPVCPMLDPEPGARVALQTGRGHRFAVSGTTIELDRLYRPTGLDGAMLDFTMTFDTREPVLA